MIGYIITNGMGKNFAGDNLGKLIDSIPMDAVVGMYLETVESLDAYDIINCITAKRPIETLQEYVKDKVSRDIGEASIVLENLITVEYGCTRITSIEEGTDFGMFPVCEHCACNCNGGCTAGLGLIELCDLRRNGHVCGSFEDAGHHSGIYLDDKWLGTDVNEILGEGDMDAEEFYRDYLDYNFTKSELIDGIMDGDLGGDTYDLARDALERGLNDFSAYDGDTPGEDGLICSRCLTDDVEVRIYADRDGIGLMYDPGLFYWKYRDDCEEQGTEPLPISSFYNLNDPATGTFIHQYFPEGFQKAYSAVFRP